MIKRLTTKMKAPRIFSSAGPVALLLVVAFLLPGCGEKETGASAPSATVAGTEAPQAPAAPPDPVDMSAFIKAFASGDQGLKLYAEETVAVIRARSFADAAEQLGKMSRNPKLTAAQRAAVQDLTVKLQGIRGGR